MKLVYETKVTSTSGREGQVRSDDNKLDLKLSKPGGEFTNPEQLFAAGYSACFNSAINSVARKMSISVKDSKIHAHIKLYDCLEENEGYKLGVKLLIEFVDVNEEDAWKIINEAHNMCPYSQAIRNNVDVKLELVK